MSGRAILTAAEMRAAEQSAIDAGTSVGTLMGRAGVAAAEAIWRYAGPLPTLVLCGPGNNGGDGYVLARTLMERGVPVRVAALAEPKSPAAIAARQGWAGPVERFGEGGVAILVDALFGTGLTRGLDTEVSDALHRLGASARIRVAIDLPSGVATDDGAVLSPLPDYDLTITFGTLKPSHRLQPAARYMGRIVVADIGVEAESNLYEVGRPRLAAPGPDDHKYRRGYVALLAGEMPGAASLAATAAVRAGAGYVRLMGPPIAGVPQAVVQSAGEANLADERIGALALGPGLGHGEEARRQLRAALASAHALVLDADALAPLATDLPLLFDAKRMPILTPHAGEFDRLFGTLPGSKVEQAREAARRSGSVILFKGSDTVIAAPGGRAAIAPLAPHWLASAGTGDVLTGIVAAMRARGLEAFEAACVGAWLHGRAAELAGPGLIADDLPRHLPAALAECL